MQLRMAVQERQQCYTGAQRLPNLSHVLLYKG